MLRFFAALLLLAAPTVVAAAPANWTLSPVSSRAQTDGFAARRFAAVRGANRSSCGAARGEWESFQFVVTAGAKPIENLQITPNGLATIGAEFIESKQFSLWRENYVRVEKPSGNRELRPLYWPDALLPLGNATRIEAGQSAVFWATIRVPIDAVAGDYFGELDVMADGENRRLALTLGLENQTLPAPTFRANVALYYDVLRDWYTKNLSQSFHRRAVGITKAEVL